MNTHIGRIQHIIEFSLHQKKVVLTEEDVAQFHCSPTSQWFQQESTLTDLFTIMVRTGKVSPKWHSLLSRLCLFTFARMYSWELSDMLPSLSSRIKPFLDHPDIKPHEIIQLLLLFHRAILDTRHANREGHAHIPDLMITRLAHECLSYPPILSSALLSNKEWTRVFHENIPVNGFLARGRAPVEEILLRLLPQYRRGAKMVNRARLDIFKEGLMAAAWHPDRVAAWLDYGGFEFLELIM